MNLIDVEQIERDAGADDIGDGIDRAHFVKMNFFDRDPVNLRLGLAQTSKHGRGVLFCPIWNRCAVDQFQNPVKMPVISSVPGFHVKFRRCDSPPRGFFDPVTGPEVQAFQDLEDGVRGGSRVDQGADGHVAADA